MAGILKVDRVQSDSNLAFQVGSANVAYINSTGLNITGGEIIAGGSTLRTTNGMIYANSGIAFPATQVSSSDPNTLDDYEEGTFSPGLSASVSGSFTYIDQRGTYVKIGKMVHVSITVQFNRSTASGNIYVTGLPFVCNTASGGQTRGITVDWYIPGGSTSPVNSVGILSSSDNRVAMFRITSGFYDASGAWWQAGDFPTSGYFWMTFSYETNT